MCGERDAKTDFAREALRAYRAGEEAATALEMAARKLGIKTAWLSAEELHDEICAWLGEGDTAAA